MRGRRVVVAFVAALLVAFAAAGIGAPPALARATPSGYERVDVTSAGISILVPDGMRRSKVTRDIPFSAFDGGKYVDHSVTVLRSKYTALPSRAALRANVARLVEQGDELDIRRTSVADEPAVVQTLTLGETTTRTYFFEPQEGRVVAVGFTWPTAETSYAQTVDEMIADLRISRT